MRILAHDVPPTEIYHSECERWHLVEHGKFTRCDQTGDLFEMADPDHVETIRGLSEVEMLRRKLSR